MPLVSIIIPCHNSAPWLARAIDSALAQTVADKEIIFTDSGGIQEEAPTFQKPTLVMRENTERPEVIQAGCGKLVGTNPQTILAATSELLQNRTAYQKTSQTQNPFGDGHAAERIVSLLY
jgi:UDP-N-acetylglucosamine 2-epimerase (non-hydrolysing)